MINKTFYDINKYFEDKNINIYNPFTELLQTKDDFKYYYEQIELFNYFINLKKYLIMIQLKKSQIYNFLLEFLEKNKNSDILSSFYLPTFPNTIFIEVNLPETKEYIINLFNLDFNDIEVLDINSIYYFFFNQIRILPLYTGRIVKILDPLYKDQYGIVQNISPKNLEIFLAIKPKIDYYNLNLKKIYSQKALNQIMGKNYEIPYDFYDYLKLKNNSKIILNDYYKWDGNIYFKSIQIISIPLSSIQLTNFKLKEKDLEILKSINNILKINLTTEFLNNYKPIIKLNLKKELKIFNEKYQHLREINNNPKINIEIQFPELNNIETNTDFIENNLNNFEFRIYDLIIYSNNKIGAILKIKENELIIINLLNEIFEININLINKIIFNNNKYVLSLNNSLILQNEIIIFEQIDFKCKTIYKRFLLGKNKNEIKWLLGSNCLHKIPKEISSKSLI